MQPVDKLLARLIAIYGPPQSDDIDTLVEELRSSLQPYGADVLTAVGDRARAELRWFPKIAELIEIANAVRWDIAAPAREAERRRRAAEDAASDQRDFEKRAAPERIAALVAEFKRSMAEKDLMEAARQPKRTLPTRDDFERMQRSSRNWMHKKTR